ncbi:MAG: GGDEF domain-containing protein [Desulfuromonadaceae bacterium]|nr:GGDEF domain-containing protein [Desulfuromonadaceae bacterium]
MNARAVGDYMYRHNTLVLIAAFSTIIALALPLYLKFIAYPAYEDFLTNNVEEEMKLLASQMVKDHHFSTPISQSTPLNDSFIKKVEYIQRTVGLPKIKIFSTEGIIVYSTDPVDIGAPTSQTFFPQMLSDGRPRTELKVSIRSKKVFVETYVPIIDHGVAMGAFEIYRDITGLRQAYHQMIRDERRILYPVIILLLAGGFFSSYLAHRSMAELKQARDQFQQLSVTDILTGLLNRRGFTALVDKQLSMLNRCERGAFLLFIDMDDFKRINDNYGHEAGDQALVETAGILKNTLRFSDSIARIGGDEFAALTVGTENPSTEEQIKQRLLENLAAWNRQRTVDYTLSFSIGIVEITPDSACNIDDLMSRADEKMYREKQWKKSPTPQIYPGHNK